MNSTKCELLTLRKPTRVDELVQSVPKPKNAVPKNGLPLWSHLPLDAKLPVLKGPKRELFFTRDKIGRKLWQNATQKDFILSDPNCLDVSYDYDSLHDANLHRFFKNKVNRQRMFELGLVTRKGDAICNLKDYNNYRRYLKRVHEEAINVERVKMEENGMERFLLRKAKEDEDRDLMIHSRKRIRKKKMRLRQEMLADEARAKEDRLIASQNRHAARLEAIAQKKEEDLMLRMEKAMAFQMKIQQRNRQAQDIERKRKIKALRKWHDNEVERRKRMTKEKWKKIMEKEWSEYHHLHQKIKCQEDRMTRQKGLLDNYQQEMAIKAEVRRKNVEYKRLKMEDKLMKVKAEKVRNLSEHVWSIKAMVKALYKAMENRIIHKSPEEAEAERAVIEKTIQLQMAEFKNKSEGKEVLAILQGAKRKLDTLFGLPEPVTLALDSILNTSIVSYVKKKVELVIADTVNQAENFKKQHDAAMREHNRKKLAMQRAAEPNAAANERPVRRASIRPNVEVIKPSPSLPQKVQSLVTTKSRSMTKIGNSMTNLSQPQRLVSFGTIITLNNLNEQAQKEGKTEPNDEQLMLVRRTKDRPPTPVPSLTELVDAAFQDPFNVESTREADVEKKSLDQQIAEFAKKLLKVVLKKADMKVETKRKNIYRQLSNVYLDNEIVVSRITDAILLTEEPNLMNLPEVEHISNVLAKDLIVKRAGNLFLLGTLPLPTALPPKKTSNSKIVKKLVLMEK